MAESQKKPSKNEALKYAGMGTQMLIAIGIGVFIGKKLDAYFQTERPVYTAVLALVFLVVVMYSILKGLIRNDK